MIVLAVVIFWASLARSCGRTSAIPLFVAALARLRPAAGARGRGLPAARRARDRRLQRGRRDRGQARERARARLPARAAAHRRRLGRLERRAPTRSCGASPTAASSSCARRAAARSTPRTSRRAHALDVDVARVLRRQLRVAARTRSHSSSRRSPTRRVAYVCGRLQLRSPEGTNQEGAVLALRDLAARARVARALGDRRQRLDLRRAARALRGGRPALRPRPLVPVPHGQARLPRRLRAATPSRWRR